MFIERRRRNKRLGMCYFAAEGEGGSGGAGGNGNANPPTDKESKETGKEDGGKKEDLKFSQEDINKVVSERLAAEKAKHEKEMADFKANLEREAELAKMSESERDKAEKEELSKKLELLQNQINFEKEKTATVDKLSKANLDVRLIDVLMSDKTYDEKITLMAEIQKDMVDKAIKEKIPGHKPKMNEGDKESSDSFGNNKNVKYGFEKFK